MRRVGADHLLRGNEAVASAEDIPLAVLAVAEFAGATKERGGLELLACATDAAAPALGLRDEADACGHRSSLPCAAGG